jgi:nucleoside-diphosphate-sugar epimerase
VIADELAGRRIAVTGATGFLGTALVERLLRSVPDCQVLPLVRPGRRAGAAERVRRDILRNDAFDRLRREWGDAFDAEIARRVRPLGGDVSVDGLALDEADLAALAEVDVVIHSAAAVSFDSPLDAAVAVNLLGPSRVAQALTAAGSSAHLVAVSTAYVAGNRRGEAPEALLTDTLFSTEVDWRAEVAGAARARADADAESRRPERLRRFMKAARGELGAAGTPLLASRAERLREQWVDDRLVELGRARAAALGWPDAYAYTKALGERALAETRGEVPVSIVRPSIIESALADPYPGWIRGFRMAEPVIISYARGLLKEFPGLPEGIVDVIPVDYVVAAALAVAAGAVPEEPVVYQAVTGARNPLKYRTLVDLVQDWFSATCRSGEPRPTSPPLWRSAARRPSGPSGTWSCTAPTWRPRRASTTGGWRRCGTRSPTPTVRPSASTPARSTGRPTSPTSTCRRSSTTPGCGRGPVRRAA